MAEKKTISTLAVGKKFRIGEIVTLKSNHLSQIEHYEHIWLAGDQNFTTPLMVVTEITINVSQNIDENTGRDKSSIRKYRYKCFYFSNKQLKFEENWFYQEELLENQYNVKQAASIKPGQRVVFKTNSIEVGKRKSFIEQENKKKNHKSSSLLSFSSPVFIVVGYNAIVKKEPEIDLITGEVKHEYSNKNVKVKFFNSLQDKFSEYTVPIEVLSSAEISNQTILDTIIDGKKHGYVFNFGLKESNLICTIDTVQFVSDDYILNYTDFFTKDEESLKLSEIESADQLFPAKEISGASYPKVSNKKGTLHFDFIGVPDILNTLSTTSKKTNRNTNTALGSSILHLKYQNEVNKYTERYVIPLYVAEVEVPSDLKDAKKGAKMKRQYLKAFCLLRNADRFFRADRISSLDVINDTALFEIANELWQGPSDSSDLDSDDD
jgi:hypothetical protein